jgi:hypothetical protein
VGRTARRSFTLDVVQPGLEKLRALAPALLTFVAARLVVLLAAMHAHLGFPGSADLARADSFNYLSIAMHGYIVHPCPPQCTPGVGLPWSGNSGWFPLYPFVLAPFAHLHVGTEAGAVVAALCQLATYALLWFGFVRGAPRIKATLLMGLGAVFPGSIYLAGVFPLSMLTMLLLAGFWFLRSDSARGVAASSFLAALTYPLGCPFGPAVFLATRRRGPGAKAALAATFAALLLIVVAQWLMTGRWNAYLLTQKGRGDTGQNPLTPLLQAKASTLSFLHDPTLLSAVPQLQTTLVVLIVIAAVAGAGLTWSSVTARCVLVFVLICWLEPLVLGGTSYYRNQIALFPALILLRRVPAAVIAAFFVIAAPIAYWLAVMYFRGQLN